MAANLSDRERFRRDAARMVRRTRWLQDLLFQHMRFAETVRNAGMKAGFPEGPLRTGLYAELDARLQKTREAYHALDSYGGGLSEILDLDLKN